MKRCLIVEDIEMAAQSLKFLIEKTAPNEFEIFWGQDADEAIEIIQNLKPDLIFMDIQLGGANGFDILDKMKGYYKHVIFTTAYSEYAIKAFKYHTIHYLTKPINRNDLAEAIERFKNRTEEDLGSSTAISNSLIDGLKLLTSQVAKPNSSSDKIYVLEDGAFISIDVNDIYYLEAQRSYCDICCYDKKYNNTKTLGYFQTQLSEYTQFKRIHKSFVVNCNYIKSIKKGLNSTIELSNGVVLPISGNEKDDLYAYLGI